VALRVRLVRLEPRVELDMPGPTGLLHKRLPTPLMDEVSRPPIAIELPPPLPRGRGLQVMRSLAGPVMRLARATKTPNADWDRVAEDLAQAFQSLGGVWVKAGQLLSLRADIFPITLCDRLAQLQSRAVGFPPETARKVIEEDLGQPIDALFDFFQDAPIAAASISQVHRAVIRGGSKVVAIKVQRPGMKEIVEADMAVLERLIRFLEARRIMPQMRWVDAFIELRQIMREEVDYRYELSNARRLRKALKDHKVYVPRVFRQLSNRRVLTMEYLGGVIMSDYIEMRRRDPARLEAWLRENNIEPDIVGRRLFGTAMRQLLEDNLFHADPHPGNIMLLRDSRIALIDLGTVGSLDYEFLTIYRMSLRAMANRDYGQAVDLNLRMSPEMPPVDLNNLRARMVRVYANWAARSQLHNIPYKEKSINTAANEIGRVLSEYKVPPSWTFMRVSRTWLTIDASLAELIEDVSYVKLFEQYFRDARKREAKPGTAMQQFAKTASTLASNFQALGVMSAPMMRRRSLNYESSLSKVAKFNESLFLLLSRLFVLGAFVYLLSLGYWHTTLLSWTSTLPLLEDFIDDLPRYEHAWWPGLIGAGCFLLSLWAGRVARNFGRQEIPK
jgi:ubiquinone biosynthesis protein